LRPEWREAEWALMAESRPSAFGRASGQKQTLEQQRDAGGGFLISTGPDGQGDPVISIRAGNSEDEG
jgi:hypothetical protein